MALLCDGKWDIFLCNCDECEQDHVHCGCSFCHGAIVSRATAFRHRARDCQSLPSCSAADGSSGDELDEFELESCTSETNSSVNHSMDCSIKRVWKGIFGIRDLTKILCGNRENDKYIDGISRLDCSPGTGTRHKLGTGCGIYVCVSVGNGRNRHDPPALAAKAN